MLAASAADVDEALGHTGPASVEWKLDGARVQVHRRGDEVRIYTRNLNDITDRLRRRRRRGPRASGAMPSCSTARCSACDEDAKPRAFQDTMSAFGRDAASGARRRPARSASSTSCTATASTSSTSRSTARQRHLDARRRASSPSPACITGDAEVAAALLDESLATGHEGVMVKALDSTYDAGRRGGSWRKVKPVRTLDLVVLAAEWGQRAAAGLAVATSTSAPAIPDGGFVMVGKTFKGLTDELLAWQTEALLERRGRAARATRCSSARSWWWRSPSTACRRAPATREGWPCGSRG